MEKVSIQEASRRLHIATSEIRQCIRTGELIAERAPGPHGRQVWVVQLPEDGWVSSITELEQNRGFSPWWWGNKERSGKVHYVQDMYASSFEEVIPRFLCGYDGSNIWAAPNLTTENVCPDCLVEAQHKSLPNSQEPFGSNPSTNTSL